MNEGYKVAMYGENINDMVMMKSAHISISDGSITVQSILCLRYMEK